MATTTVAIDPTLRVALQPALSAAAAGASVSCEDSVANRQASVRSNAGARSCAR